MALTVMSFNLRYSNEGDGPNRWELRRPLALGAILGSDPDVIAFQEVLPSQRRDLTVDLPEYLSLGSSRTRGGEQCCVFWRNRLRVLEGGTYGLHPEGGYGVRGWDAALPRVYTRLRFEDFDLFNLHLDHDGPVSRRESLKLVLARVDPDRPTLIAGDFNEDAELPGWVDATPPEEGTYHAFTGSRDGPRIDHIFASPRVKLLWGQVVRCQDEGRFPSDHFPVVARVSVADDPGNEV
ncbi:MAG: endonuclease/exonuclease/phosphatase family protein [Candidatus Eremiobacterota bacterium]